METDKKQKKNQPPLKNPKSPNPKSPNPKQSNPTQEKKNISKSQGKINKEEEKKYSPEKL